MEEAPSDKTIRKIDRWNFINDKVGDIIDEVPPSKMDKILRSQHPQSEMDVYIESQLININYQGETAIGIFEEIFNPFYSWTAQQHYDHENAKKTSCYKKCYRCRQGLHKSWKKSTPV